VHHLGAGRPPSGLDERRSPRRHPLEEAGETPSARGDVLRERLGRGGGVRCGGRATGAEVHVYGEALVEVPELVHVTAEDPRGKFCRGVIH